MVKAKTKKHALELQAALVALPDQALVKLLDRCLEKAIDVDDDELEYWDEIRFRCGYQVESGESGRHYANWADWEAAEPDCASTEFVAPAPAQLKAIVAGMTRVRCWKWSHPSFTPAAQPFRWLVPGDRRTRMNSTSGCCGTSRNWPAENPLSPE